MQDGSSTSCFYITKQTLLRLLSALEKEVGQISIIYFSTKEGAWGWTECKKFLQHVTYNWCRVKLLLSWMFLFIMNDNRWYLQLKKMNWISIVYILLNLLLYLWKELVLAFMYQLSYTLANLLCKSCVPISILLWVTSIYIHPISTRAQCPIPILVKLSS